MKIQRNYYIAYDSLTNIIWGTGSSKKNALDDALAWIAHKKKSLEGMALKTVRTTRELVDFWEEHEVGEEINWFILKNYNNNQGLATLPAQPYKQESVDWNESIKQDSEMLRQALSNTEKPANVKSKLKPEPKNETAQEYWARQDKILDDYLDEEITKSNNTSKEVAAKSKLKALIDNFVESVIKLCDF